MKRFVTSFDKQDGRYGGTVDAMDFEHAQMLCDARDRGEVVGGVLWLQTQTGGRGDECATRLMQSLAETYSNGDEPPDAADFDNCKHHGT